MNNKGFSYTLDDDKLRSYMKLSTKEKLEWLEEINKFTDLFLTPQEKAFREKLRMGEI